jgi:DNA-binding NtrC family response regulator
MARILILEDEIDIVDTLRDFFEDEQHQVEAMLKPEGVMLKINEFKPELITLDISFSEKKDTTGITILEEIRQSFPKRKLPVVVISGTGDASKLQHLLDLGINDYVMKPFKKEELMEKIDMSLIREEDGDSRILPLPRIDIIGKSRLVMEMVMRIDNAAKLGSDMLILGEMGTGKELVVEKYRKQSPRKEKPFSVIDCTNIPSELFETEVFGCEAGAHSKADKLKIGKVEAANGGIVFFDEIGDLPYEQQQKLLRLLQNRYIQRIGSNKTIDVDVAILAATNKNLYQMVKGEKFRGDLFFRLKSMRIDVPSLRNRLEDIPLLVDHFINISNAKYQKNIIGVQPEVIEKFMRLYWEGNVRQLEKCMDVGVINCGKKMLEWKNVEQFLEDELQLTGNESVVDLDLDLSYLEFKRKLEQMRDEQWRRFYLYHLEKNGFNKAQTAKSLDMTAPFLDQVLSKLGIDVKKIRTENSG